jgi:hypothetical protein
MTILKINQDKNTFQLIDSYFGLDIWLLIDLKQPTNVVKVKGY